MPSSEIPASGGAVVSIATGLNFPTAIAIDAAGNLYVTLASNNGSIVKIPAGGGTPVARATGFNVAFGIAMDASGNLYVSNSFIPSVVEIKPIGGYFVSPILPAGLHFDSNTGIISGTPTAFSPAQNYTVTGYNLGGGSTAVINIKTSPVALSYVSPQSYAVNTAITPLLPTYSGLG